MGSVPGCDVNAWAVKVELEIAAGVLGEVRRTSDPGVLCCWVDARALLVGVSGDALAVFRVVRHGEGEAVANPERLWGVRRRDLEVAITTASIISLHSRGIPFLTAGMIAHPVFALLGENPNI